MAAVILVAPAGRLSLAAQQGDMVPAANYRCTGGLHGADGRLRIVSRRPRITLVRRPANYRIGRLAL